MGDLAAFVGRNESGKTTILQALTLLNRTESVSDLDLCDEMNEELKSEINIVEGEFELTKKEVSLIKEKFPNLPRFRLKSLQYSGFAALFLPTNAAKSPTVISPESCMQISTYAKFTQSQ